MELVTQLLAGAFVIGLLAAALWALRRSALPARLRHRGSGADPRLESLERLALSAQVTLHLVRVEDRVVLVGLHPGGCSLLETRPWSSGAAMQAVAVQGKVS